MRSSTSESWSNKDPRSYTVAERREKFLAFTAARREALRNKQRTEDWHELEHEMTLEEAAQLPVGERAMTHRSAVVWVLNLHCGLGRFVAANGYYHFQEQRWMARFEPEELGDMVEEVKPVAWAPVQPGVKPWDGMIVPKRLRTFS